MKSVWDGSISFGLVNIPVKLFLAVQAQDVGFKLLDAKTKTPIHYKRWCSACNEEVAWKDVVKGLEIGRGEYYIFSKEELAKLKPEKTQTIEIIEFVDAGQINPIYFNKHYYVGPEKEKEKSYFLLKEVLLLSAKMAVGHFVMREREYMCAIESYKEGLLLTTLNYNYEIRDIKDIMELREAPKLKTEELELAKKLVGMLTQKEFDISKYKDTFAEEIKKAVKKKEKVEVSVVEEAKPTKEKDLMAALKESLKK
jgi:DNA end-binding protein Ku